MLSMGRNKFGAIYGSARFNSTMYLSIEIQVNLETNYYNNFYLEF